MLIPSMIKNKENIKRIPSSVYFTELLDKNYKPEYNGVVIRSNKEKK